VIVPRPVPYYLAMVSPGAEDLQPGTSPGTRALYKSDLRFPRATMAWRYATADLRARPDFIIVGAQRSGTTSLYSWLSTHPDVAPPVAKEIHYFDTHYDRGPRWYRSHFPIRRDGKITGEASPYMLFHPLAPARAAQDLPASTRFLVLLRQPVDRTVSHYWYSYSRRERFEQESLERAIALEPERLAGETERVRRGERSDRHSGYSYLARSRYADQLRAWFDAVGRDRLLIVESERLYADPEVTAGLLRWLGIRPHDRPFPMSNESYRREVDDPRVLAQLDEYFKPYNEDLFDLLGYELWTGSGSA
jgi:Sulfotransferase domain